MVSGELGVDSIMYFAIQRFSIAQLTAVVWPAGDGMWIHGFSLNNETNSASMDRIWDGTPHFKRPMFTIAILF